LNATGPSKEKPCDSQAAILKPSSCEGGGPGEFFRGNGSKGGGGGKGGGRKGGGRSGFVRYDLNVQAAQQQVEAPGAVLGFLNTLRARHGKRQLDDGVSGTERCASLGAPRKRRSPSVAATTTSVVTVAAKAGERAAPKVGLALGRADDDVDDAAGLAAGATAALTTTVPTPIAAAASVAVFRRVAPTSKAKKQMRRRAAGDGDSDAEMPASFAAPETSPPEAAAD
jgi:hypothetical protein